MIAVHRELAIVCECACACAFAFAAPIRRPLVRLLKDSSHIQCRAIIRIMRNLRMADGQCARDACIC